MIGILAGMGPKSTGPFVDLMVSKLQELTGAKNDIDFPPMMIYSLPTPFFLDRPIDHELMEKTICTGLKKLESCGVGFIAMPCNTAHVYFERLKHCIRIPLLNMVAETLVRMPKSARKIAVLGTRPTMESEVYQKGLQAAHLHSMEEPAWQEKVDGLIHHIKISDDKEESEMLWADLCKSIQQSGADAIILACTDLNVVAKRSPLPLIDSAASLAEAAVRKWQGLRTRS